MSDGNLTVEPVATDRTELQAARAAPVSLPAGSFDAAELDKLLGDSAKAKNDKARPALVGEAVEKLNEIVTSSSGLQAGYKRVEFTDEATGITEYRTVYDPGLAEQAADEADAEAPAPARRTTKGE